MDYPKFIVSNRKEESISIQRVSLTMPINPLYTGYFYKKVKTKMKCSIMLGCVYVWRGGGGEVSLLG